MRPKLEAGKDLKKIVSRLIQTTEKNFTLKLDEWYEKNPYLLLLGNFIIRIQELELLTEV